jgi:hypothetical protein
MTIAGNYYNNGQYDLALENYLECLKIQKSQQDSPKCDQMTLACTLMCIGEGLYLSKLSFLLNFHFFLLKQQFSLHMQIRI